ncbi:MAG TPA: DUF4197 domain-containing protein [Panacibacter sp.]|nr:DUF4197 domain-containing protein [Panacibacter sp.]
MKNSFILFAFLFASIISVQAQSPLDILKKVTSGKRKDSLSTGDVVSGLKEALNTGIGKGTDKLSATDGFFKDAVLKILMPAEAQKVEKTLRGIGLGKQVDDAVLSMNRAAEDAAKNAAPIFLNAVKQMSIGDAWGILKGGDSAATQYLRQKTTTSLEQAFRPVIEKSLEKTGATKYWNTVFTSYNKFSFNKINPDLSSYVTEKAMSGIFYEVALQEAQIRKDPLARTSDILKKVFGN